MNRLIRRIAFILLCSAFCDVQAQAAYVPITPENVAQITQIERIGNGVVRALTFSPDGVRLAAATTLGVWEVEPTSGAEMRLLEGQSGAESVAFSPDGTQIAVGGEDNSVMVWDTASGNVVARLENHIYPVSAVAWAGNFLASGDWSGVVRVWDTTTWSESHVFSMTGKVELLTFNLGSQELTANLGMGECMVWNIVSGAETDLCPLIARFSFGISASSVGRQAVYMPVSGEIQVSDGTKVMTMWDGFYGELSGVFFTEDGRVGASPLKSGYRWSLETGQVDNRPVPVASPDGSRVAIFGNDGVIRLNDAATGREIAALHGHIRAITGVAFSPDGRLLASSSNDGTIQLWDASVTEDSGSLATLQGHNGGVSSVAFNADGTLLASSGYDGTVRLWAIKT